jgi:hypothetical protein
MENKGLLTVIAVVLVGILALLAVQYNDRQKSTGSKIGDSVNEVVEEIGDEIDDNTDAR